MLLRDYQAAAVEQLRDAYRAGNRSVLFVLPTGGGKTVVFSFVCQSAVERKGRVLVLVHRVELLDQASRALAALGVDHGLIAAGREMDLSKAVQVASVQTVARRLDKLPQNLFSLLVIDEAHHSTAGTWDKVIKHFNLAKLLGVTATPIRSDGRGLGEHYQVMVVGPTPAELTRGKYLAAARVYAPPIGFDAKQVRKRMGDYDMQQASQQLSGRSIMGDVVGHYHQHLRGETAIAFCCSVAHAEAVAEAFQRHEVAAASIDGTMSTEKRRELLASLASGELKVLTSCALIGEGVDVPSVGGCILLRPTQSESLHLQMIGRCLRPQEGKVAVVLDHVGNIERLGHHLEDREWSLDGVRKRHRVRDAQSLKVCPLCFAVSVQTAVICMECGNEFKAKPRELKTVKGNLIELEAGVAVRHRRREQGSARTLEQLVEIGRQRGMKQPHGWARHVLAARARL